MKEYVKEKGILVGVYGEAELRAKSEQSGDRSGLIQ